MNCPVCNSPCFDNRDRVASGWKGPLYKCKDRQCGWVQWPPKGQRTAAAPAQGNGTAGYSWRELYRTYARCHELASKVVGKDSPDLQAATATIFIQASNLGLKVAEAKAAPPPPPPPSPARESFDEYPDVSELEDDLPY